MKHPIQPLAKDAQGVLRFKENKLVRHLLDWAQARGHGMNEMVVMDFPQEDWEQFAQLIGYSLSGFSELSYVSDASYTAASQMEADPNLSAQEARIAALESTLEIVRDELREPLSKLYGMHPDDFKGTA
jgi:multidrug resistance efflux pump